MNAGRGYFGCGLWGFSGGWGGNGVSQLGIVWDTYFFFSNSTKC